MNDGLLDRDIPGGTDQRRWQMISRDN